MPTPATVTVPKKSRARSLTLYGVAGSASPGLIYLVTVGINHLIASMTDAPRMAVDPELLAASVISVIGGAAAVVGRLRIGDLR